MSSVFLAIKSYIDIYAGDVKAKETEIYTRLSTALQRAAEAVTNASKEVARAMGMPEEMADPMKLAQMFAQQLQGGNVDVKELMQKLASGRGPAPSATGGTSTPPAAPTPPTPPKAPSAPTPPTPPSAPKAPSAPTKPATPPATPAPSKPGAVPGAATGTTSTPPAQSGQGAQSQAPKTDADTGASAGANAGAGQNPQDEDIDSILAQLKALRDNAQKQ